MTHLDLTPMFAPASVAIVGASGRVGSFGNRTLSNLRLSGYSGAVHLVNPNTDEIDGIEVHRSISDLPEQVDCAIVVVSADAAVGAVEELVAGSARSIVLMASGFDEVGNSAAQQRLVGLAADSNVPILGPNCLGIMNFLDPVALTFAPGFGEFVQQAETQEGLAVVTQSGALGSFLLHAHPRGANFSYYVSTGNSAVVDVGDCLDHMAGDPRVTGFCLTFEGLRPGTRLLAAVERAMDHDQPIVVVATGRSEVGRAAALSHTGTSIDDTDALLAALDARGAMVVDAVDEMIEPALFLSKSRNRTRSGSGVAIVTGSGGAGVSACDHAERWGVPIAELTESTRNAIREITPGFASVTNPVDITAAGSEIRDVMPEVAKILAADPGVGLVLVALGIAPGAVGPTGQRPSTLAALADELDDVPLAVVWLSEALEDRGALLLEGSSSAGLFRSMRSALRSSAQFLRLRDNRAATAWPEMAERCQQLAQHAGRDGLLDEVRSAQLLEEIGVEFAPRLHVTELEDLSRFMEGWTHYPAVVKIVSNQIAHKSAIGGVRTGLLNEDDLAEGVGDVVAAVSEGAPRSVTNGVLVQEMIYGTAQVLVGAFRDPVAGPLVAIGPGGSGAGPESGLSVAAAPLSTDAAERLVRTVPGVARFSPKQIGALASTVAQVSRLISACNAIAEVDINPLILDDGGCCRAVDALVRLSTTGSDISP